MGHVVVWGIQLTSNMLKSMKSFKSFRNVLCWPWPRNCREAFSFLVGIMTIF